MNLCELKLLQTGPTWVCIGNEVSITYSLIEVREELEKVLWE